MLYIILYMSRKDDPSSSAIEEKVKELEYPKQEFNGGAVVSCKLTADELASKLGIGTDDRYGLVSSIESYSGYADKKFVEWFRIHKE